MNKEPIWFKTEGPEPEASALMDRYEQLARQLGLFIKRDGSDPNELTISGPIQWPPDTALLGFSVDPALDFHDVGCIKRYGEAPDYAAPCTCEKRRAADSTINGNVTP